MRILVSSDDGIESPGLRMMAEAARDMGDEVWIVAPERKWTAASHQLSFDRDLTLTRVAGRTYACSGAPADCVVAAMRVLLGDAAPDLALAGVNDKINVGEDVAYSGTMAIAREATFFGVPAIAFSRNLGAAGSDDDRRAFAKLVHLLWDRRGDWAAEGHWLAVNLPAALPAPIVAARIGRDKIAGECDVIETSGDRIRYRIRRGRPGTVSPGEEASLLVEGRVTVVRHRWDTQVPLGPAVLERWNQGLGQGSRPD